jgi:hypothetical protein
VTEASPQSRFMLWRLVPKIIEMNFLLEFKDSTSTTSTLAYRARGDGTSVKTAIEMIRLVHPIADHVWDKAAKIVLREIRAETGIRSWLPKLLNGRSDFESE